MFRTVGVGAYEVLGKSPDLRGTATNINGKVAVDSCEAAHLLHVRLINTDHGLQHRSWARVGYKTGLAVSGSWRITEGPT